MASLARKNSVSDAIMERRLRPIYDFLDSGMNKKAIQEADRLLKKHTTASNTIQALKAIAYLRLGKHDECLALITPIFNSVPTDDNTIQALTVCYRELNKPEMVCQLLENSIKKDKSEDNLTYCFMSYVRVRIANGIQLFLLRSFEQMVQDFQKQHQIAMTLYKAHPKPPYFSWAIMSLLVKSIYEPPEAAERITLPLAERMTKKFVEEQQNDSEYEMTLYYLVLYRMQKYEEAYEVLKNTKIKGISWTPGKYVQLMWECLKKTQNGELMMSFLENYLTGKMNMDCRIDSWKFYSEYVAECTKADPKRVEDFLVSNYDKALKEQDVANQRSILIAMLKFRRTNLHENLGGYVTSITTMDCFKKYIDLCGSKNMFYHDIGSFFSTMIRRKEDLNELLEALEKCINHNVAEYAMPNIIAKVNMAMLSYNFNSSDPIADAQFLLKKALDYVETHLLFRTNTNVSKVKDPRDTQPYDTFLVLASHCLLKSVFDTYVYRKIWEGSLIVISKTAQLSQQMSNSSTEESINYVLTDDDIPLLLSMMFMEYGLSNSPFCSPLRIMLGKAYMICGANLAGTEQFQRLDIKHAQIESLGYLYFWKMLRSGLLNECFRLMSMARNFYSAHTKESMEHVLSGYKYGAWDKILEFMDFRKSIFDSIQAPLLKVEQTLLEFTKEANSHDASLVISQKENFEVKTAILEDLQSLKHNWDLNTMQNLERERLPEKQLLLLVEEEREKLRIRSTIASLINSFLMLSTEIKDENRFNYLSNYVKALLEMYVKSISGSFEEYSFTQSHLEGPWSPTLWNYKNSGCLDILKKAFQLLLAAAQDANSPEVTEKIKSFEDDVRVFGESQMQCLECSRITPLVKIGEITESFFSIVETIGFLAILLDVLKCFLSKDPPASGKSKKKKNKEAELTWSGSYDSLLHEILKQIKTFDEMVSKYHFKTGTYYQESWDLMKSSLSCIATKLVWYNVLAKGWPQVAQALNSSYKASFTEMLLTLESKQKYIESLLITPVSAVS